MNIYDEKKKIREDVKEIVNNLSDEYIKDSNYKIISRVLDSDEYKDANTIFTFVSTSREIDTISIIKDALNNNKTVGVPKCVAKGIMEVYEIKSLKDLTLGKYDILEPKNNCNVINKDKIDLVIMPCVTCNEKGQRLGYGGGYYDRYLEHCDAKKLIMCREILMKYNIPMASHDILMDMLVTEEKIYKLYKENML